MVETAVEVGEILKDAAYQFSIINVRFVKPVDEEMLEEVADSRWPLTKTSPAIITLFAFSRDSAKALLTSSISRRSFFFCSFI